MSDGVTDSGTKLNPVGSVSVTEPTPYKPAMSMVTVTSPPPAGTESGLKDLVAVTAAVDGAVTVRDVGSDTGTGVRSRP